MRNRRPTGVRRARPGSKPAAAMASASRPRKRVAQGLAALAERRRGRWRRSGRGRRCRFRRGFGAPAAPPAESTFRRGPERAWRHCRTAGATAQWACSITLVARDLVAGRRGRSTTLLRHEVHVPMALAWPSVWNGIGELRFVGRLPTGDLPCFEFRRRQRVEIGAEASSRSIRRAQNCHACARQPGSGAQVAVELDRGQRAMAVEQQNQRALARADLDDGIVRLRVTPVSMRSITPLRAGSSGRGVSGPATEPVGIAVKRWLTAAWSRAVRRGRGRTAPPALSASWKPVTRHSDISGPILLLREIHHRHHQPGRPVFGRNAAVTCALDLRARPVPGRNPRRM